MVLILPFFPTRHFLYFCPKQGYHFGRKGGVTELQETGKSPTFCHSSAPAVFFSGVFLCLQLLENTGECLKYTLVVQRYQNEAALAHVLF